MRLAYLIGRYPAISHTFILREVRALRRMGWQVHPFSIWATARDELISRAEREEAASTYALLPPRPRDWLRAHLSAARRSGAYLATLRRALRLAPTTPRGLLLGLSWFAESVVLWHRCDSHGIRHIHVHLGGTAPAVALLACELAGGEAAGWSYSMTVHGPMEFYDVYSEALAEKVAGARLAVCISDYARSQLMAFTEERHWEKLHVVHCGIDPADFRPAAGEDREGPLQVVCVGRLVQVKGQATLIDAAAELERRGVDVEVELIGDGPKRADLEALAAERGVPDRVRFAGSVSQEQIRDRYARADAFCLPSFAEGVPVVLMEAMAMELPVVTTAITGVGELVEDGVSGLLVRPGRVDQLADAFEYLARDPALRRRLGVTGREKVRAEYDIEASATQLDSLFASVLGR